MLQEINKFGLEFETIDSPKSTLKIGSVKTDTCLIGTKLEKQFKINENYLLITSFNDPFNEELSIYLLDKHYKTLDTLFISFDLLAASYSLFMDCKIVKNNQIEFKYEYDTPWTLTILEKPRRFVFFYPDSVHRPWKKLLALKYFVIKK